MSAPSPKSDRHAAAVAAAGLTFALVPPLTYVTMRTVERARAPVVNPGLILASTHMDFVWRSLIASWFGTACALLAYRTWRDAGPDARWAPRLAAGIVGVGALLAAAALRYP